MKFVCIHFTSLTLILLTWRIWRASINASRWQMGFKSAFKGLMMLMMTAIVMIFYEIGFRFPHQNPVHASPLPHTHYVPRQSHSYRFYRLHNIGRGVAVLHLSYVMNMQLTL
jgi:hypothetical protein